MKHFLGIDYLADKAFVLLHIHNGPAMFYLQSVESATRTGPG